MTKLVGIAGRKGAGKDTAANVLVEERGYVNVKFADGIKKAARLFFEFLGFGDAEAHELVDGSFKEVKLDVLEGDASSIFFADFVVEYADELAPILGLDFTSFTKLPFPEFTGNTSREFQQFFGTEIGRTLVSDTVWTDQGIAEAMKHEFVVISDMRFPNEVDAVITAGGTTIRVERNTSETEFSNHPSEQFIDGLDVEIVIDNNHKLNDLYWSVLVAAGELPDDVTYDPEGVGAFVRMKDAA